jgi:hypothetical protein
MSDMKNLKYLNNYWEMMKIIPILVVLLITLLISGCSIPIAEVEITPPSSQITETKFGGSPLKKKDI